MKVIFITGYWKTGTTLLQYLLSRDKDIQNIFPTEDVNFDGTQFWVEYTPKQTNYYGHYISPRLFKNIKIDRIRKDIGDLHDGSKYILLKRP